MPILGADMQAGTLVAWHKGPGDTVRRGEIIADVETDKAVVEVEVFTDGVVEELLVQPGEKVPVGTPLAIIREPGETTASLRPAVTTTQPLATAAPMPAPQATEPSRRGPRISPAARKLARELGIDVSAIVGTGPGGRVQIEDVQRAVTPAAAPAPSDRATRMRQAIAAAMTRSSQEIPHFYLQQTIDMAAALAWLAAENARRSVAERLLSSVLLIKATALALRDVPELNATWAGDHVERIANVHVGVAISLRGGGLVAPALHDANQRSLDELMRDLRDLVGRARAGTLRASEMSDPTITVTNLGDLGAEAAFGIIFPPQVALVGFGRIVERPWVVDGAIVARPVVVATLSADHRVADGHRGSVFLAAIDRLLQEPQKL